MPPRPAAGRPQFTTRTERLSCRRANPNALGSRSPANSAPAPPQRTTHRAFDYHGCGNSISGGGIGGIGVGDLTKETANRDRRALTSHPTKLPSRTDRSSSVDFSRRGTCNSIPHGGTDQIRFPRRTRSEKSSSVSIDGLRDALVLHAHEHYVGFEASPPLAAN